MKLNTGVASHSNGRIKKNSNFPIIFFLATGDDDFLPRDCIIAIATCFVHSYVAFIQFQFFIRFCRLHKVHHHLIRINKLATMARFPQNVLKPTNRSLDVAVYHINRHRRFTCRRSKCKFCKLYKNDGKI